MNFEYWQNETCYNSSKILGSAWVESAYNIASNQTDKKQFNFLLVTLERWSTLYFFYGTILSGYQGHTCT